MKFGSVLLLVLAIGCASKGKQPAQEMRKNNDTIVHATLWFQTAAEVKALYYQGYNFARIRLDEDLKKKSSKKRAVVVDIDETILDNSPYQAKIILENVDYPKYWNEWIQSESGKALPGALEFLNYADKKGVEVFYITNRKTAERSSTLKNLQKLGFPVKSDNHLLERTAENNKTARREIVGKDYHIVLLVGDNLNDFTGLYEKKSIKERSEVTDKLQNDFGKIYIMLPNPMYGDWESAVYNYNNALPAEDKDAKRKSHLTGF